MPYSQFTIEKVKQDFHLNTVEGVRFFPESIEPVHPSLRLQAILEDLPWAIAVDTEKARSEVIINPVLLEVRQYFSVKGKKGNGKRKRNNLSPLTFNLFPKSYFEFSPVDGERRLKITRIRTEVNPKSHI
ncbi:hypothetical protein NIES2107_43430 [Nostoc carneum NIES-2107]|nr:hypothetical protein NIES2107_43430 [Nostoc carneum NIES-2107]